MQRVGRQRLASRRARRAMQRPRAPEIDRDIDRQHHEGNGRERRRRSALAQAAPGFDQDAAGQHVEQRDDKERRQALELAVAVMMFVVGGQIRHPHHQPGDDGRDHVDRGVQGLRDQRERADRDADREFGRGHAGAGEDRDRGDVGLDGVGLVMGGGLAGHRVRSKLSVGGAIATHSQERSVANCSEFKVRVTRRMRVKRSNPIATPHRH